MAPGFDRARFYEIVWPATCRVVLRQAPGGHTLVAADGTLFWSEDGRSLAVRPDPLPSPTPEPHPQIRGATFIGSAALMAGDWRVGAWRGRRDWLFARYRPESSAAPVPMLRSVLPVLGLGYLGAPDAPGGSLSFVQQVAPGRYRAVSLDWSEAGLRP